MNRTFDITALLRVAVQDERSGEKFYAQLADRAESPEIRSVFSRLSEQEKMHAKRFQEMLDSLEKPASSPQYPDEYVDYLEILVAQGGHGSLPEKAAGCGADLDAVDLAMSFEREQLALQRDIGELLGGRHAKIINALLQEEQGHLVQLGAARKKLASR